MDPRRPENYFFLTELVNLPQTYWKRKRPEVAKSAELIGRLAYGRKLHSLSRFWFSKLDGFELSEGSLNGYYAGVPDVSGRVDFRIRGSVYELKTKPVNGVDLPEVTSRYFQDLEQLLFYAAISVNEPRENYLVFLCTGGETRLFRAYKVLVGNLPRLREEMRTRVARLRAALASSNPSDLGRCHYAGAGCEFSSSVCQCDRIAEGPSFALGGCTEIVRDEGLETSLARIANSRLDPGDALFSWDLMTPQRWYRDRFEYALTGEPADFETDPMKEPCIAALEESVVRTGLVLRAAEANKVYSAGDADVRAPKRYIRVNTPGTGSTESPVPFVTCFTARDYVPNKPSGYFIAQLSVLCARAQTRHGVIALAHPYAPAPVSLYLVSFDLTRLHAHVESVKSEMRRALRTGRPADLPGCPEFMRGSCKFQECGCRPLPSSQPPAAV